MAATCDIPVLVLAGGGSERFGSNKALADFGGKPLIAHVIERLATQTTGAIAINAQTDGELAHLGAPIVSDDVWHGQGPLAGVHSALNWARMQGAERVATTAVDLPFVPLNLIATLSKAGAPSIAMSGERHHPVTGLWSASQIDALDQYLRSGRRSAHGWAEYCEAGIVEFRASPGQCDPFYNINTPEDLERAASYEKARRR